MGYVIVKAKICNVNRTKCREIELIADTGAIYTVIPKDILLNLGVRPKGKM